MPFQAAASDQSRLLGRGPRDPGRLLREEKMRKRVVKEKPRVCNPFSSHDW
jgi:Ase1/PRC1/MAP65 family protein